MQERFPLWGGQEGRRRLSSATAVVVGVGALGCTSAGLLARAGIGRLRLIDPDLPSLQNLHRQTLFTEADVQSGLSKAEAAAKYLRTVNGEVLIQPLSKRLEPGNAERLLKGAHVVLDGLDNMESRYVLNEACHFLGVPWVHGGVVGSNGQLMVIRPERGPCLRCWCLPGVSNSPKWDVSIQGVIGPTPSCIASMQVCQALKLIIDPESEALDGLLKMDMWSLRFSNIGGNHLANPDCPACNGKYEYLKMKNNQ